MPETRGQGGSLAAAFRSAVRAVSLGHARPSYTAAGPVAQFRQLSRTRTGYSALERAGVSATTKTQARWLAGEQAPSGANAAAIRRAYEGMRQGGIPEWVKRGEMQISGRVRTGRDDRDRGSLGNAPLRVDASAGDQPRIKQGDPGRTHWEAIEEALEEDADDDDLDELISDLIAEDIPPSDFWEFPGGSYTVVFSG